MLKKAGIIVLHLILLSFYLSAQTVKKTNYDQLWKKVDTLIQKKGLTKSALTEVNKIYTIARMEKQDAQMIKALLYRFGIEEENNEEQETKTLLAMEKEAASLNGASKALMQSSTAQKYLNYLNSNRYRLYGRTSTVAFAKDDIATWTLDDLHKKIVSLFLSSLANEKLLQQTKLDNFDPLIIRGNVRHLRPALYDLLAHKALQYFEADERGIQKPAYVFEMDDPKAFDPSVKFIQHSFPTRDSSSLQHKALLIYQSLLSFHLKDAKPDALIDVDIQRLEFVQNNAVLNQKTDLFRAALTDLIKQFSANNSTAQASYLLAKTFYDEGARYDVRSDTNNQFSLVKAKEICDNVLKQYKDSSEGFVNCYNLIQDIEKKELHLQTEKVNVPNKAFRTLVSYRNTANVYLRIIPVTDDAEETKDYYNDEYWKRLVGRKFTKQWSQVLPSTNDYQKHSTEIKVDALPPGRYILLASAKQIFSLDKNPLAVQYFNVSNISYVGTGNANFFVLHRETGEPLPGAAIQVWERIYDYNTRAWVNKKTDKFQSDKNGFIAIPKKKREWSGGNLNLEVSYQGDKLFLNEQQYIHYREEDGNVQRTAAEYEKANNRLFLFTDRGIYRPGQPVYFKGIGVTRDFDTRKQKVAGDKNAVVIRLINANGEGVDSIKVNFNEYGSFNGRFTLPSGTLNGEFRIETSWGNNSQASFLVEEYKRPKFYVDYEKQTGTYKLNDSITVRGFAKAYAGNNIDGAGVKYRVKRITRFPYPWLYYKIGFPRADDMEITNGVIKTAPDGSFTITFKAIPDEKIDRALSPVFNFDVSVDVTDANGETRSSSTMVAVGYQALQLSFGLNDGDKLHTDSLKDISITSQNLAGVFEKTFVTTSVYKLVAPSRLIRKRYWPRPDQFVMTEQEFVQQFPRDEYRNETEYFSWEKGSQVLTGSDSTNENGTFALSTASLEEGWYLVEATAKDKYGETVKDARYVQLYNSSSKKLPSPQYDFASFTQSSTEPGGNATVIIATTASDVFVIQRVDKTREEDNTSTKQLTSADFNFLSLNNEKKVLQFPITEADRGGYGVSLFFVKDNRFYSDDITVDVSWRNKDLDISYETFRDKILPGSSEKWKLKIAGFNKEKAAAELLAGMYDYSLDQFRPHDWYRPSIWPGYSGSEGWSTNNFMKVESQEKYVDLEQKDVEKQYDDFLDQSEARGITSGALILAKPDFERDPDGSKGIVKDEAVMANFAPAPHPNLRRGKKGEVMVSAGYFNAEGNADKAVSFRYIETAEMFVRGEQDKKAEQSAPVQIRKNFNETAFFFPDLRTDSAGNISFEFTIPDALTKWKFQALAHTKDLSFGSSTKSVVTQKPLMIQPNAPRFMREGDQISLSAKVVNMTEKELTGTVQLELLNAATMQPVDGWFRNMYPVQYFTADGNQSTVVNFTVQVPYQYNSAVVYRFVAKAGDNSDGEEAAIPVLTNSMLVTESMPLPMRGNATKNFRFEKLLKSGESETLQQYALTVEFTSNPAWYAVQALPYIAEYPYECAEQLFNRYYANALATKIANSTPKLKETLQKVASPRAKLMTIGGQEQPADTAALLSTLQKNPELKSILLEETPWVLEAKSEAEQRKNIALLFDAVRMSNGLSESFEKLKQAQSDNGGFVWFKGGPDDRYITQYILSGIGHLKKLNALNEKQSAQWNEVVLAALGYVDARMKEDYDALVKSKADLSKDHLGYIQVQYLYLRSFFPERAIAKNAKIAADYYRKQAQQFWLSENKYMQGMIALALYRGGDTKTPASILRSLKENSIMSEEMGMYWKQNAGGYFWHQAPIETQSLLIEAFSEINKDTKSADDMKTWLLKQKQTQSWSTTRATAEACYALLLQGSDWLSSAPTVELNLGDKKINNANAEPGSGYFKNRIEGPFVKPAMGEISVKIANGSNSAPSWGAVYWQYFERLENITASATPLKLTKKLFVEELTDKGPVLRPVNDGDYLKVGNKIKVRIELRVDRDMEYVHMKDMRASCLEPVNVLSGYKWQDGLGYYESTKDASTNFFFNWLRKGTYVFEYPLFVTHTGNFSNGVTSIQCMYAPEFASHSEGVRINVE